MDVTFLNPLSGRGIGLLAGMLIGLAGSAGAARPADLAGALAGLESRYAVDQAVAIGELTRLGSGARPALGRILGLLDERGSVWVAGTRDGSMTFHPDPGPGREAWTVGRVAAWAALRLGVEAGRVRAVLEASPAPERIENGSIILGELRDREAVGLLIRHLDDPRAHERHPTRNCLLALARIGDGRAGPPVLRELDRILDGVRSPPRDLIPAVVAVEALEVRPAAPRLARLLGDTRAIIEGDPVMGFVLITAVVRALERIADRAVAPALVAFVRDFEDHVALQARHDPVVIPQVRARLVGVLRAAARTLGTLGDAGAVDVLLPLLGRAELRGTAVRSLVRLGDPRVARPVMLTLLGRGCLDPDRVPVTATGDPDLAALAAAAGCVRDHEPDDPDVPLPAVPLPEWLAPAQPPAAP